MVPLLEYDPLDPATLANPYPVYAQLREQSPVFWHELMQSWVLTRYEDCIKVLRDYELFARDWRRVGEAVPQSSLSVQSLDPPAQTVLRSLFLEALHLQDLDGIGRRVQDTLTQIFVEVAENEFEVQRSLAAPLALQVISDLLGIVPPDLESFGAVSDAIMRSMDAGLVPEAAEPGRLAKEELTTLVELWLHTADQAGLLTSVMRQTNTAGIPENYVRNTARVMFQGGYSTMSAAIGNVVLTLLRHPWVLDQLAEPRFLRKGVNELIRYDGPVQGTSRVATRDTRIAGTTLRKGQAVLVLFGAANHDPKQFHCPDTLVLDRSPNQHLGFGWGPHSCIGTTVIFVVLRALITSLLAWPKRLSQTRPAQYRNTATMRSPDTLFVAFAHAHDNHA